MPFALALNTNCHKSTVIIPLQTTEGDMYLNSLIIGVVSIFGYTLTSIVINAVGNKNIIGSPSFEKIVDLLPGANIFCTAVYGLFVSGCCGLMMYWAKSSLTTLILSSIYVTISSVSTTALVGTIVALFPTSTRTMVVSLTMMFGRLGAMIGNVLFPHLIELGCMPPFLMIGAVVIGNF
jgi:MFS family permease